MYKLVRFVHACSVAVSMASILAAFVATASAQEIYRFPNLKPEDKQPLAHRTIIETAVRCPNVDLKGTAAAITLWKYVSEETKKRIETALEEKIKEVGLDAFCTNMGLIFQNPGQKIEPERRAAKEEKLDVTVLRVTRDSYTVNVLVAVDNPNDRSYDHVWLSCVAYYKGQPVYESTEIVTSVKPTGRTVQQVHMWTKERMETVDCRFTRTNFF